jgi:hypothetical protein
MPDTEAPASGCQSPVGVITISLHANRLQLASGGWPTGLLGLHAQIETLEMAGVMLKRQLAAVTQAAMNPGPA